jgi:DNA-binding response OmpR family regulator
MTAYISILFVTVSGDIKSKIAAYNAGADDYLVKPFDLQELNLRVKALLLREEPGQFEFNPGIDPRSAGRRSGQPSL